MDEMMKIGIEIMLVGMGVVFVFLILLIGVVIGLARIIQHYAAPVQDGNPAVIATPPNEIVAAIAGGIHAYRQHRQREARSRS